MNGAEAIVTTAVSAGIRVCFANPGTTELALVAALDNVPGTRGVLGTFEGVCSGAADGYARMADRPAWAMVHLGPGLANAAANLHNARRARSPVVTVVGDHASWHRHTDPPLASDIPGIAAPVSDWVGTSASAEQAATGFAEAASAAAQGQVATLLLPSDHAEEPGTPAAPAPDTALRRRSPADPIVADTAARLRRANNPVLLLGGRACRAEGLRAAAALGLPVLVETFPARLERGADLPDVPKLQYLPEAAREQLAQFDLVVLAGARAPITFFGYLGQPSELTPSDAELHTLATPDEDAEAALLALAVECGVSGTVRHASSAVEGPVTGPLDLRSLGAVVAATQPEGAVVVDESATSGGPYFGMAAAAPSHTYLTLTGGAIGFGPPAATGAAVACPDRQVINLQADGSALYTVQALWTQAREGLDVTTVVCANQQYRILRWELNRSGVSELGQAADSLTDLARPTVDWMATARGFGVPARCATTADELAAGLAAALAEPGPHLIEASLA